MSTGKTEATRSVARRYFDAWTSRNKSETAAALAPDFEFSNGAMRVTGRDAFLSAAAFPPDARVTMVAEAYEGDTGFQMYDAVHGDHTARIVEQLTVRNGLIARSTLVTDMVAFMAFVGG